MGTLRTDNKSQKEKIQRYPGLPFRVASSKMGGVRRQAGSRLDGRPLGNNSAACRRIVSEYAVIRTEWIVGKHKVTFRG